MTAPSAKLVLDLSVAALAANKEDSASTPKTLASSDDDEEEMHPWEDDDWVPLTKTGQQKSPNQIRSEFQRYLDTCGRTQKSVLEEARVSNGSFRKYMDPRNYKNQWSAVQNDTYWRAARFLAKLEHDKKTNKRKSAATSSNKEPAAKKSKSASRADGEALLTTIMAVETPTGAVYDTCPQVVAKIKKLFKDHPEVTKASFCRIALENANNNSLAKFLAAKKNDQQGNQCYPRAYAFFEKMRVHQNEPKSKARLKNERETPGGFDTTPKRNFSYIFARF